MRDDYGVDTKAKLPWFHWKDGWFFERLKDGSVQIVKKESATDEAKVIVKAVIPADEWVSIVAFVSAEGSTDEKYREAQKLHKELKND